MDLEIKGKIITIEKWHLFIACLSLVLIVMFPNFQYRLGGDCYKYAISYYWLPGVYFYVGRYFAGFIYMAVRLLGINPVIGQQYFFAIYVFILAFCSYLLLTVFLKLTKINNYVYVVVSLLTIVSIFVSFVFSEAFAHPHAWISFMAAKLLTSLSIWCFFRYEKKKGILLSAAMLLLALWSYQSFYQLYLIICLTLCIIRFLRIQNIKFFTQDSIKILFITTFSTLISYLSISLVARLGLHSSRWLDYPSPPLLDNIRYTVSGFLRFVRFVFGNPLLIVGFLGIFLLFCVLLVLIYKVTDKHKVISVLSVTTLPFVIIFSTFGSGVFTGLGYFLAFRQLFGLAAAIPVIVLMFITLFYKVEWVERIKKYTTKIMVVSTLVIFTGNMFIVQTFSINQVANNRIDENIARVVYAEILRHEELTGSVITQISMVVSEDATMLNYGITRMFPMGEVNLRALVLPYNRDVLDYVVWRTSGRIRPFAYIPMDNEVYEEFFKGKEWDVFVPEEQLIFIDNTLFWMHY